MVTFVSASSSSHRATPTKLRLRKRLLACFPHFHLPETEGAARELQRGESVVAVTNRASASLLRSCSDVVGTSPSESDTEALSHRSSRPDQPVQEQCCRHSSYPCSLPSTTSTSSSTSSTSSVSWKGVTYGCDGALVSCRFCKILKSGDEPFLYEDEDVIVFRPLAPVVVSHILVVPRRHIRNVNEMTLDDAALLLRMREVASMVLREMPRPSQLLSPLKQAERAHCLMSNTADDDFKFAFHSPPFNSIDHVHMHAFRTRDGGFGCAGFIKYYTETWWCRSFDEVTARISLDNRKQCEADAAAQKEVSRRSRSGWLFHRTKSLVKVRSKV
uniref:HIT domain-containing protein n=1 Tax=Peronospora matthiolae TaxID=2874970 RepID=A0AAV1UDK1_9STRA